MSRLNGQGLGEVEATLINAGNPLVLVAADRLGIRGTESQAALNRDSALLSHCEALRVAGALAMGLAGDADEARTRQHTPKLALLAPPAAYTAADGKAIAADRIDLNARVLSMGVFHHAIPGTAAIALATAAAIPGTLASHIVGAPVTGQRTPTTPGPRPWAFGWHRPFFAFVGATLLQRLLRSRRPAAKHPS